MEKDRKKLFVCLVILPFSSRRLFGTIAMLESSPSPKWVAAPKLSLLPEKSAPTQRRKEGRTGELTRARNHFCSHLQGRGEEDGSCGKLGEAALEFCLNEHSACSSGQILPDRPSCSLPYIVEQLRSQPWARRPVSNQGFRGREKTESPLHARRSLPLPSIHPTDPSSLTKPSFSASLARS